MAEENAEAQQAPAGGGAPQGQKPTLFIILAVVNMLVIGGVGAMIYMAKQKEAQKEGIDDVVRGELEQQKHEAEADDFIGKLIPLETFLVNLAESRGRKVAKVNMEFEVNNEEVLKEIDKVKPKIRDMILIILSGKTYDQVSTKVGKDKLREEIKDKVNLFLTKGQIKRVYFTEFIYN